ncbi:16S rRNA (guanine(527)-N(7))-methyltransferase RsmG [Campylobacter geochelonis]|uniref:Ribosomal RNA small subunit methyltransferase G n=1 Tax=Campylobacter geochelonis TaxID=1780362 RepID=A0A128EEN6_9BACT|nr:16S rRNA (guanine(527)-N(7))-methyltransferase RsmG [Campylobacter geochelonis]QKF70809.1 16S rRNA m7G527 methyltransferase [Campylobacter geochelonis]CZE47386.1 methyltransferase GidB [Campylobacter geochelonis]CZE48091.1 methyltransferase GidB [Campylobacter geochelonis]
MKVLLPKNFDELVEKFNQNLKKFNQIHSLTNYKNIKPIVEDSIKGLEYVTRYPKVAIDVGSGAGFPAIFLAMILEHTSWHLFEPNPKKAAFLTYVKVNLALKNVTIHKEKIENGVKFKANLITSRALMSAEKLIEICSGYYDEKSEFLLYKGSNASLEVENLDARVYNDGVRNYVLIGGLNVG